MQYPWVPLTNERVFSPVPHLGHPSGDMVQLSTRLPPLTLSSTIDLHYRAAFCTSVWPTLLRLPPQGQNGKFPIKFSNECQKAFKSVLFVCLRPPPRCGASSVTTWRWHLLRESLQLNWCGGTLMIRMPMSFSAAKELWYSLIDNFLITSSSDNQNSPGLRCGI